MSVCPSVDVKRVAVLIAVYSKWCCYNSSRQKESEYLQLGKQLQTKMDQQKAELEKADQFPENSNTEVSKLREQLLNYNNQLAETDEMNYQLQYKLER